MKKKIIGFCLTVMLSAAALTSSAEAANLGGATVNTGLRLRSGAGTNYTTLAVAQQNEKVIVKAAAANGWYQVIYDGTEGYMSGQYLSLSDNMDADFGTGTIAGTQVRFRAGASLTSEVLGSLNAGDTMKVTGVRGAWYRVSYNGITGYVHSDYLRISKSGTSSATQTGTIKGTEVRFRAAASTSSKILGVFPNGASVTVLSNEGDWYKIRYNGTVGYVYGTYLNLSANNTVSADALIATAKSYLGTRYVYGGSTPSTGFDCSGLMQYVFAQHGISISRTAALQYSNDGTAVSKANLRPGDLVFFSSSDKAVGHVGLYMGNDQMIHASSGSGKVIISNITTSYYVNHYVGAKRVL